MSGSWSRVDVAGHVADVYDPPGGPPRFALIALHGAGLETLHSRYASAYQDLLAGLRLACICPQTGFSWWAHRLVPEFDAQRTPEQYVIDDVASFARARWNLGPRALGLIGISMGGQGALRIGFRFPEAFPVVAALAATVDCHEVYGRGTPLDRLYDSKEQCRQDTAPMHLHPSRQPPHLFFACDPDDDWHRGNDRLHEKLDALGVPHVCDLSTRAGGHSWAYFNHFADRVLHFLHAGLEQEGRRLL
jgi:esterase/lipase superfamily enzyme